MSKKTTTVVYPSRLNRKYIYIKDNTYKRLNKLKLKFPDQHSYDVVIGMLLTMYENDKQFSTKANALVNNSKKTGKLNKKKKS